MPKKVPAIRIVGTTKVKLTNILLKRILSLLIGNIFIIQRFFPSKEIDGCVVQDKALQMESIKITFCFKKTLKLNNCFGYVTSSRRAWLSATTKQPATCVVGCSGGEDKTLDIIPCETVWRDK